MEKNSVEIFNSAKYIHDYVLASYRAVAQRQTCRASDSALTTVEEKRAIALRTSVEQKQRSTQRSTKRIICG